MNYHHNYITFYSDASSLKKIDYILNSHHHYYCRYTLVSISV